MKYLYSLVTLLLLISVTAFAQVPRTISYQGQLTDGSGNAVPDGNKNISIAFYTAASGGSAIYSESQTVAVVKGKYTMIIGSVTPIPPNLSFNNGYFLGVSVEGGAELSPRTPFTSAPYALHAAVADGVSSNATGIVTSLNNLSGDITLSGGGGTTITANGHTLTISSSGSGGSGIQGLQSGDGTLTVLSSAGPVADVRLAASGILTKFLADAAVTAPKISAEGAGIGQVLTSNGFGIAEWKDVSTTGTLSLPYSDSVAAPVAAFTLSNVGTGHAVLGIHSSLGDVGAGVCGQTNSKATNASGVLGLSNSLAPAASVAAVRGQNSATNANGMGVYGIHNGGGAGVYGQSVSGAGVFGISGTGSSGSFSNTTVSNSSPTLLVSTSGSGAAFSSTTTGTGRAGLFTINLSTSAASALEATTNGAGGVTLKLNHTGSSGNIAVFQNSGANVARIDKTGKGFFNGGTQASGADVAEAFAVVGDRSGYEPGDVLVIASGYKRTVEKCSTPYATNVIGVHATKPGMLLTERGVEANLDDLVPMGVVGVLPTKVCNEGGAISAGDLLVTSSRSGYAMKADPEKLKFGMAIGKALEDFSGDSGMIEVFVNVK